MLPALAALLCLGLSVSLRVGGPSQAAPRVPPELRARPRLWAEPGAAVPKGTPVTLWCQGAPDAEEFRLQLEGRLFARGRPRHPGGPCRVAALIPAMSARTAGRYSCSYRSGGCWSEPSDALDLVVTGMYDKPTLWAHPGPVVTLGERVTLFCSLETATSSFFLLREGRPSRLRGQGTVRAEFPLGPVTAAHQGAYRCFGSYSSHTWSLPSAPVELRVTGGGNTSSAPAPTDSTSPDAGKPCAVPTGVRKGPLLWDLTGQNLLRVGLALLVLVALVVLLAEDRLSRGKGRADPVRVGRAVRGGPEGGP